MGTLKVWDSEVGREFEGALLVRVGEGGDVGSAVEQFAALQFDRHSKNVLRRRVDCLLSLH